LTKVVLVTVEDEAAAATAVVGEVPQEVGAHPEEEVAVVGGRASREAPRSLL
jgi:hypothetical protein